MRQGDRHVPRSLRALLLLGCTLITYGCGRTEFPKAAPTSPDRTETVSPPTPAPTHWQVAGLITEISSGRPVSNVYVSVLGCGVGATRSALTDSRGQYVIDQVVSGSSCDSASTITLRSFGFETKTGQIDLTS